jgi:hypothetical protein
MAQLVDTGHSSLRQMRWPHSGGNGLQAFLNVLQIVAVGVLARHRGGAEYRSGVTPPTRLRAVDKSSYPTLPHPLQPLSEFLMLRRRDSLVEATESRLSSRTAELLG